MKCSHHPAREASAICLACGRAVCQNCLLESENGIACRPSCANILSEKNMLQDLQSAHFKNLKRLNILGSFFSIVMGGLFIYFSFLGFGAVYDFVLLLGIGFVVYGIAAQVLSMIIYFRSRKNKQR